MTSCDQQPTTLQLAHLFPPFFAAMASSLQSSSSSRKGKAPAYQSRFSVLNDEAKGKAEDGQISAADFVPLEPNEVDVDDTGDADDELHGVQETQPEDEYDLDKDDGDGVVFLPRAGRYQRYVSNKNFPREWEFSEPGYEEIEDASILTAHYAGRDKPDSSAFKHPHVNARLDSKVWAIVHFINEERMYGQSLRGQKEGLPAPWLKMSWFINTQRPCFRLHITTKAGQVTCNIFVNSMVRSEYDGDPDLTMANDRVEGLIVPEGAHELRENCDRNSLMEVRMSLFEPDETYTEFGPMPRRPVFDGISLEELKKYASQLPKDKDDITELEPAEEFLGFLYQTKRFSAYRTWPDGGNRPFNYFRDWMKTAFNMCARYGNQWFYSTQTREGDPAIGSSECQLEKYWRPRWMGTKFLCQVDEHGEITHAPKPVKCATFACSVHDAVFPDIKEMVFELRMGTARNKEYQSHILKSSFRAQDYKIRAIFKPHPRLSGCYFVELRTSDNNLLNRDRTLRPQIDSRIRLEVARPVTDDGEGDVEMVDSRDTDIFNGNITDDLWNSGAEVTCIVSGTVLDLSKGNERSVAAELRDDPTSSNRWRAAIEQIQQGVMPRDDGTMRGGVDIPAIVLRTSSTIERTDSFARSITTGADSLEHVFEQAIGDFGLSEKQTEASLNSLRSKVGFTLIQGPPGCGKTRVAAGAAKGHINVGKKLASSRRRQILACAPSNIAVDTLLDKFVDGISNESGEKYEIVRYRGSFLREKRKQPEPEDEEKMDVDEVEDTASKAPDAAPPAPEPTLELTEADVQAQQKEAAKKKSDEEMQEALWELADERSPFGQEQHEKYAFHLKRHEAISRWSQQPTHIMHEDAKAYLEALRKVKNSQGFDKEQRCLNRLELESLEEAMTSHYFEFEVDIVFCTNSSSAHGILREHYQPKVLISDEAAVTTLPDAATPMAAFMNTIEGIIMCGDHKQQQPIVASRRSNEFYATLQISLFALLFAGRMLRNSIFVLQVQHRMHPDLSKPISNLFYEGILKDHPTVISRDDPKWRTLESMLEALKPAWNGRRRLAFDVSGANVRSEAYNETTSFCNIHEARVIVDLIKGACARQPPANGAPIEAKDFLVLSTYSGQAQLIRNMLVREQISKPGNKTRVARTRAIQGEQSRFVIMSMTRNDPGRPLSLGLLHDPHSLNVAMSRPEEFLCLTGNFKSWIQAYEDGAKLLLNQHGKYIETYDLYRETGADHDDCFVLGRFRKFGQVIHDLWLEGDMVSMGDLLKYMTREAITAPEFPSLIRVKPTSRQNKGGSKQAKFVPKAKENASRADLFKVYEQQHKQEEKGKKKVSPIPQCYSHPLCDHVLTLSSLYEGPSPDEEETASRRRRRRQQRSRSGERCCGLSSYWRLIW